MSDFKINKTDAEWREQLSDEAYHILRNKGTERPHTGKYNLHFEEGTYKCAGCNQQLFESASKFDAHCGWPSFDESIKGTVKYILDKTHGMIFNDGPTKTGTRYCVNSLSVTFEDK